MSDPSVAIFWDYENCCPPSTSCGLGYAIVNNIRRIARLFGSVTSFRAYLDISAQSPKSVVLRSELQSSGVSMIDCPHNGKKDVVDKMILVDMLAFAIDHPAPATVLLIAGDRDYAYAVSILKLRRYQVILVVPSLLHTSPYLESQASLVIDWGAAILKNRTEPFNSAQAVRQPYLDLDPSLVAKLLRELFPDDTDTTLQHNTAPPKLRRITACDLLEPCKHSKDIASVDSIQEFTHVPSSPRNPPSAAIDSTLTGLSVPGTPSRSEHTSVSKGSTRARAATIAEQQRPTGDPPHSGARDVSSPSKGGPSTLPPLDAFELPPHENSPPSLIVVRPPLKPSEMPVSGTLSSRGLNCLASPFVATQAPTGLESAPIPCTTEPVVATSNPLADTVTAAYDISKDARAPAGLGMEDSDGSLERSSLYASSPVYSPLSSNLELRPTEDSSSGERVPSPEPLFLGVIDDDDSAESAPSSCASSALDHSIPDFASVLSSSGAAPSDSFTTDSVHEQDEGVRLRNWTTFKPLIHLLFAAHERGIARPSRSIIATELVRSDKHVYQRAGVTRFRDYTALAEQAGVIKLGGREADTWIALHPDWFQTYVTTYAHVPSSRVSSPMSDPPGVVPSPSLSQLMDKARFLPAMAPSPKPRLPESSSIMETLATDRQDSTAHAFAPGRFQPLIDVLIQIHPEGFPWQALRSVVGQSLNQDVYAQVGVSGFREYVHQASEAQVIQCGGVGGHAWIRLHPELRK